MGEKKTDLLQLTPTKQNYSLRRKKSKKGKNNKKLKNQKDKEKSILSLPRTEAKWLSSDLLSSGILFDEENNKKEIEYISSILPQNKDFDVNKGIEFKENKDDDLEDEQMDYKQIISITNKIFP